MEKRNKSKKKGQGKVNGIQIQRDSTPNNMNGFSPPLIDTSKEEEKGGVISFDSVIKSKDEEVLNNGFDSVIQTANSNSKQNESDEKVVVTQSNDKTVIEAHPNFDSVIETQPSFDTVIENREEEVLNCVDSVIKTNEDDVLSTCFNPVIEEKEDVLCCGSERVALLDGVNDEGIEYLSYESEIQMPSIMKLIQKDLSEPYSIYTYRYFIHNWPKLCFLAMEGDTLVGAIVCKLDVHKQVNKRGYIAMLAVDENHRRKKIGSSLVLRSIRAMANEDADEY